MWTLTNNKTWAALEVQFHWVTLMKYTSQDHIHHAEGNVAIHTQMVLEALVSDVRYQELSLQEQEILWAAALLHDVEKFNCTVTEPNGRITSAGHARKGAQTARQILYKDIPTPFEIREQIWGLVRYHSLPLWLLEKPDPLKTLIKASFEVDTKLLAILARADMNGRICEDKEELLYRVDCFEEYCKENNCFGTEKQFQTSAAKIHYLTTDESWSEYVPFIENKEQPLVILMSGLPGSGKDTYIKKHFSHLPLISLDNMRIEEGVDHTDKSGNGRIIQKAKEKAKCFLRRNVNFVWNATNITSQMRSQLIELFHTYKASVSIIYLETSYETLLSQNRNREAVVPYEAMERMISKLEVPKKHEANEVNYIIS